MATRRVRVRAALAAFTAAALAVVAAACAGGGGDKAGGKDEGKPLVLTLESEDDLSTSGAPEFADAVEQVSGGSMRIEFLQAGRGLEVDFEKGVVEDVRNGRAQLGIVGVRVWDTMGVTSFQALLTPFLVDSYELERRVLESPLAVQMLDGVEEAGVVAVALLPGPLRRPFGLSRAFVGVEDYRGATIGIRPGGVAQVTFRTLGAAAKAYVPGSLSGLDGTEVDPKVIVYNGWERQPGALTTNVVLWPKPYSIVMNREAFEALTSEQQEILRSAGGEALAPELLQIAQDEAAALTDACKSGTLSFVSASAAELAALREAVQPVYDELERNSLTRELIAEIGDMRGSALAAAPTLRRCREAGQGNVTTGATPLEGRWRLTWTRAELIAVGIQAANIPGDVPQAGSTVVEFKGGRYKAITAGRVVAKGTYTVEGDVMSLVFVAPVLRGYVAGQVYRHRWNIYRNSLTFSRAPGSDADLVLLVNPLTRVR